MNTEHKQSISLTPYAEAILKNDLELFAPDQTSTGFLNDIIERFSDMADASIHSAILRQRERIGHALEQDLFLSAELTEEQKKRVIQLLDSEIEYRLLDKSALYSSGRTFTFRLNNRNYKHFFSEDNLDWPDADYYGGYFSRYLKAVVEEYCRLPLFRREEVYFQETIETIETAITFLSPKNNPIEQINFTSPNPIESFPETHLPIYVIHKKLLHHKLILIFYL